MRINPTLHPASESPGLRPGSGEALRFSPSEQSSLSLEPLPASGSPDPGRQSGETQVAGFSAALGRQPWVQVTRVPVVAGVIGRSGMRISLPLHPAWEAPGLRPGSGEAQRFGLSEQSSLLLGPLPASGSPDPGRQPGENQIAGVSADPGRQPGETQIAGVSVAPGHQPWENQEAGVSADRAAA